LLLLVVHFGALRSAPLLYARCFWWWIIGKRLRARLNLAPLLGRTRHSYALWLSREPDLKSSEDDGAENISILALVSEGAGQERTLESAKREGFAVQLVSAAAGATLSRTIAQSWVLPLMSGDVVRRGAGARYRAAAFRADDNVRIIYADDDLIDENGKRFSPHLKPDWNAELYSHLDYLTGSAILRTDGLMARTLGGANWAAEFTRLAVQQSETMGSEPVHLRSILHHRRTRPAAVFRPLPVVAGGRDKKWPAISIIIPTRNRVDLLRHCLEGVARTEYPGRLEVIIIDNASDDPATLEYLEHLEPAFARVRRDDGPFNFAALNNRAASEASGDLLCFLNNDIEIVDGDWLTIMATQCQREEIGAVGARLLYPDGRIQHAGVVIGIGGAAAHAHRLLDRDDEGYFHRHSLPQFVTAVTAACMVVRRDRFLAVGGFDAERFAVSFNDVDLCLRLGAKGWHTLYEPRATLVHHESVSRGLDRDPMGAARQSAEVKALQDRWDTALDTVRRGGERRARDPFHHPQLSPLSEQFALRL